MTTSKIRRTMAIATTITTALATSCAHNYRKDPEVIAQVDVLRQWLDRQPRCDRDTRAMTVDDLKRKVSGKTVAVRGLLELDVPTCTRMDCDSACCNGCSGNWVLVPTQGLTAAGFLERRIAIQRSGKDPPPTWGAMDCQVESMRALVSRPEVILTGKFEANPPPDRLVDASVCVLQ